ncbi:DUF6213 family protein [Streptomyces sp. NBC_00536]|uniref:DUF6213 family protein n=1 Tax=Streptomyces sp. NBC_00536 TaxID=2975769 RepID=UPI002E80E353|nr:DUF6213 family protein [Streptomyces sp. NBC_00536]WUC82935.1 DUF6213 family protein [Streptomyces sp. NBC_00536]
MIHVTLPLVPGDHGGPLIPADHVTALLRTLAVDWRRSAEADEEIDGDVVERMAGVLNDLADSIDVECIAFTSQAEPLGPEG